MHTPGPWKVEVDDDGDCFIRIPDGHDLWFGDMETTDTCCFANAHLIAAAPALLEAAELVVLFCEIDGEPVDGFRFREGIAKLRAAIAQAKGGE